MCGATYEEIAADYLVTYDNYYGVNPENKPDVCATLLSLRLDECLMHYANTDNPADLKGLDYGKAFADYLLSHGMNEQELDKLVKALTE